MLDKMKADICTACVAAVPIAEMNEHGECAACVRREADNNDQKAAVKLRNLAWTVDAFGATAPAFEVLAFYKINGAPGAWTLFVPGVHCFEKMPFETQVAAKNAAQADFKRRVLASIEVEAV